MVIVRSTHRCVYTPSRPYLGGTTTSIPEMAPPWCPSYLWTLLQSNLAISGANELLKLVWAAHNTCPRLQRLSKWSIGPRFAVNLRFHPRNAQNVPKTSQNRPKTPKTMPLETVVSSKHNLPAAYDLWPGWYGTWVGPYGASLGVPHR